MDRYIKKTVFTLILLLALCTLCSCKGSGFRKSDLEPVNDVQGTHYILVSVSGDPQNLKVSFTNIEDTAWLFGEYYKLEVFLDDTWYYVPAKEDYLVHDLAHELLPDATDSLTYDLSPFGELPTGSYRIACGDLGANTNFYYGFFEITDSGDFIGTTPTGLPSGFIETPDGYESVPLE